MPLSKKKSLLYACGIALLLLIAYSLRFVFHDFAPNSLVAISMMTLRWVIHVTLTVSWCLSIRRRILNPSIRRMLLTVGGLLLFWQIVRIIKYDYVIITEPIGRYCWYGFYIPMVLVSLIGVFITSHIGKPETYRCPSWMKYLFIPAFFLIATVFTNDLHQKVFVFHNGFALYNSDYGYDFMYIVVMAWFVILALFFVLSLMLKSRVPGNKRFQKMPLVIALIAILFWLGYSLKLYNVDLTAIDCLIVIMLLESAIQSGLIPSNMNYRSIFNASALPIVITDKNLVPRYHSSAAFETERSLLEKALTETVDLGDTVLHSQSIGAGHVFWKDDVSEINRLTGHLLEANELLSERNHLLKAELDLKEQKIRAEEKARLYDRIARDIEPKLNKANDLIRLCHENSEESEKHLARLCVIGAYIKRRANLILLGEESGLIDARELDLCIRESLDHLALTGAVVGLDAGTGGATNVRHIVALYDFFENTIEAYSESINACMIRIRSDANEISLLIELGLSSVPETCPLPDFSQGSAKINVLDKDVVIKAAVKKEAI